MISLFVSVHPVSLRLIVTIARIYRTFYSKCCETQNMLNKKYVHVHILCIWFGSDFEYQNIKKHKTGTLKQCDVYCMQQYKIIL